MFGGRARQRQEWNQKLYDQCEGLLVYFGEASDLWTLDICDSITRYLGPRLKQKPAAICVGPPPERPPNKKFFGSFYKIEGFEILNWSETSATDLERWTAQVLRALQ